MPTSVTEELEVDNLQNVFKLPELCATCSQPTSSRRLLGCSRGHLGNNDEGPAGGAWQCKGRSGLTVGMVPGPKEEARALTRPVGGGWRASKAREENAWSCTRVGLGSGPATSEKVDAGLTGAVDRVLLTRVCTPPSGCSQTRATRSTITRRLLGCPRPPCSHVMILFKYRCPRQPEQAPRIFRDALCQTRPTLDDRIVRPAERGGGLAPYNKLCGPRCPCRSGTCFQDAGCLLGSSPQTSAPRRSSMHPVGVSLRRWSSDCVIAMPPSKPRRPRGRS